MPNVSAFENQMPTNLSETSTKLVTEQITAAGDSLYRTSKEKYDLKARLIENADDMTTKEKLDALDHNYDRHNQEVWLNIIFFGAISFALIGIAAGNPTIIRNIRSKLVA